jgi:hypothetical protein
MLFFPGTSALNSVEVTFFDPAFAVKTERSDDLSSSSEYSSSSSSSYGGGGARSMSHLANHSYAASSDLMFSGKSSPHSLSYDFDYDGASAMASGSPMSFW